ncbi:GNAT family N-acetyltransferase [Tissierella sp.]|uniref:GNAT family N-acetyltransferase n=1 Tax=Tissierella sp. TaxID=41274 RepID=UPI0028602B0C|nr:GNAT family N-acetyltransferase [Tissierella sp.]MDR7856911.1 GNAT family N-acetyltransferase [Tissierella sp.]
MVDISNYELIHATNNDCDLVFKWANDKDVRLNSFNSKPIKYEDHKEWFKNKIESNDSIIYLFKAYGDKVGLIRLDKIESNTYVINYNIAKEHRGKGHATNLLKLIKDIYKSSLLIGKVKKDNIGSVKAFLKAGYRMEEELDIYVFYSFAKE